MAASICAFILTLSALCVSRVVSGVLSPPINVRLTSDDMDLVLRWDPPEGAPSGLVYTTAYQSSFPSSKTGCVKISALECDFTQFNISVYGSYFGKVQAQLGSEESSWVESNTITMDKETSISPPNVHVFSSGASLELNIEDPAFRISSLKNVYGIATYNITYWKDGFKEQAKSFSVPHQNRVFLSEVDPWSKYCVQVQINTGRSVKPSKPSRVICESTTAEEAPWEKVVVAVVVMVVVVALVVVVVVYWKHISQFINPKDLRDVKFKESLLAPLNSSIYMAMRNAPPLEEVYHPVRVEGSRTVKEGGSLEAAGRSSNKPPDVTVCVGEKEKEETEKHEIMK
ncbi:interleukin-10 receptor subunit beta-like [Mugil cephalus]|uniref:interleukin-10 receptor subunit beta-like n=1 Tax=Mugil cephalus TaxID=48193 RepID=UPI001FB76BC6|nr:interleukin-10 receptor subunit beta-like [Mugil cephalus]